MSYYDDLARQEAGLDNRLDWDANAASAYREWQAEAARQDYEREQATPEEELELARWQRDGAMEREALLREQLAKYRDVLGRMLHELSSGALMQSTVSEASDLLNPF